MQEVESESTEISAVVQKLRVITAPFVHLAHLQVLAILKRSPQGSHENRLPTTFSVVPPVHISLVIPEE